MLPEKYKSEYGDDFVDIQQYYKDWEESSAFWIFIASWHCLSPLFLRLALISFV